MDGYEMFMNPDAAKEQHQVTLPYDALQLEKRSADVVLGRNTGFYPYEKASYVKKFEAPADWDGKLVEVEFEAVYMRPMVYINDNYAGSCPHGYTCFRVDATPFLKIGEENEIKVVCKMSMDSRWYSGLGIYRNVNLYVTDPVRLAADSVKVTTVDIADGATITVSSTVENKSPKAAYTRLIAEVFDAEGRIVAKNAAPLTIYANTSDEMTQRIHIKDARLWDTEDPYLYNVKLSLAEAAADCKARYSDDPKADDVTILDEYECAYGIRTLSLDAVNGLRINGKEVLLRGACVHHDNGLIGSAAINRAEERRVELLKKAGFNAVRSSHNPISKAFLDACDRCGVLVMDELTDMWTHRKGEWDYSTEFVNHWPALCESIVAKDYNHPSVIMYSIGNEIHETGTHHGAVIGRKLAKKLKELDPTRYTTNSVNLMMAAQGQVNPMDMVGEMMARGMDMSMLSGLASLTTPEAAAASGDAEATKKSMDINEIMQALGPIMALIVASDAVGSITEETFASVDIAGYNYAASRYEGDKDRFPDRVIVGSETFPQDIAKNWDQVKTLSNLIGDFTWTGWDYIGEAGIGATNYEGEPVKEKYPWYIAWCGDIDVTGKRRPVSYYREIVFGLRKDPYFAVRYPECYGKTRKLGSWDFVDGCNSWTWPDMTGKEIEMEVYTPGDVAEVFVNGKMAGRISKADGSLSEFKGELKLAYELGNITIVSYEDGAEIGRYTMETAGEIKAIKAVADRTEIKADTTDLCYVDIDLVDEAGYVKPAADMKVSAVVEGAGYLAGFGSAKPTSEESFLTGRFKSYQGHLLAIVRPTGIGEIRLTISAEGLDDVLVSIKAE